MSTVTVTAVGPPPWITGRPSGATGRPPWAPPATVSVTVSVPVPVEPTPQPSPPTNIPSDNTPKPNEPNGSDKNVSSPRPSDDSDSSKTSKKTERETTTTSSETDKVKGQNAPPTITSETLPPRSPEPTGVSDKQSQALPPPPTGISQPVKIGIAVGVVLSVLIVLCLLIQVYIFRRRAKRRRRSESNSNENDPMVGDLESGHGAENRRGLWGLSMFGRKRTDIEREKSLEAGYLAEIYGKDMSEIDGEIKKMSELEGKEKPELEGDTLMGPKVVSPINIVPAELEDHHLENKVEKILAETRTETEFEDEEDEGTIIGSPLNQAPIDSILRRESSIAQPQDEPPSPEEDLDPVSALTDSTFGLERHLADVSVVSPLDESARLPMSMNDTRSIVSGSEGSATMSSERIFSVLARQELLHAEMQHIQRMQSMEREEEDMERNVARSTEAPSRQL